MSQTRRLRERAASLAPQRWRRGETCQAGSGSRTAATVAARYKQDPLGFVRFAFPWGKDGTELAKIEGPRQWQTEVLDDLGRRLRAGQTEGLHPVLKALCSGHGTGKSALISWLIVWAMATCVDAKVLVTSGTEADSAGVRRGEWYRR
jgi:hypothetical protein